MDENRAAEFTGRVLADSAAAATIVLAALGDRTGLFKDLAAHGPATSGELASRTGLAERYVREWLRGRVWGGPPPPPARPLGGSGPAAPGSPSATSGSGSAACSPPATWTTTTSSSGTRCPL